MLIELPDHYLVNIAVSMVRTAAEDIAERKIIPAYIHQYADAWSRGITYGGPDTFWEAVTHYNVDSRPILEKAGLL